MGKYKISGNKKNILLTITLLISFFFVSTSLNAQSKQPISNKINDPLALESAPSISFDGESLVYMSNKTGNWRLYESQLINAEKKEWSEPVLIEFANTILTENISLRDPSLNYDGKGIYFSADLPSSVGFLDLYFSKKINDIWQEPVNLGPNINTEFSERSPSISSHNNDLYFVRKNLNANADVSSCSQIYYAKRMGNEWSKPSLLPSPVNIDCENYPYIGHDNKTLYFSSIRDGGLGGYDLYISKMVAENIWTFPVPISIVNTIMNELDPSFSTLTNQLVFTLASNDKKVRNADIYSSAVNDEYWPDDTYIFKGKVTDEQTKKPILATLLVRNKDNLKLISSFETDEKTGNYTIIFSKWINYEIEIFKHNYSHVFYYVNTNNYKDIEPLTVKNISLFNKINFILNTFDEEIFEPLQCKIDVNTSEGSKLDESLINYPNPGRVEIELEIGNKYSMMIQKANFEDTIVEFDLTGIVQFDEFEKNIELRPKKSEFVINIADIETDEAIDEVEIIITNLEKNETIVKRVKRDENGKFAVDLRDGDKYEINVNGPKGYAFYNTKVDMADKQANKKLDVKLKPLTAKTKLVLNDITFETNSAELNKSSFDELNRVVKLLIDNPEIKIEISAHTDDIGSANYNQKLSEKRAQSVVYYLTDNNLPVDRLIAKGYGEKSPLQANDTEENRAKNRRVELKIIDQTNE